MYVWMDGWLDGCMDGWMDGWMDGRTDGWMDERMHGWMNEQRKKRFIFWFSEVVACLMCSPVRVLGVVAGR